MASSGILIGQSPPPALTELFPSGWTPSSSIIPRSSGTTIYSDGGVLVGATVGSSGKTFMRSLVDLLPSKTSALSTAVSGLELVAHTPKTTLPTMVASTIAGMALDAGLGALEAEVLPPVVSALAPSVPAIRPSSVETVNKTTVNAINNFSPTIQNNVTVKTDSTLLSILSDASRAQSQAIVLQTATLNAQLGMMNEQIFGQLAYQDLFLQAAWDANAIAGSAISALYDTAPFALSDISKAVDAVATRLASLEEKVGTTFSASDIVDKLSFLSDISDSLVPFSKNQEWKLTEGVPLDLSLSDSVSASPRDIENARNFSHGKGEADTNILGATHVLEIEDIFDGDVDIDSSILKLFNYIKVTDHLMACAPDANGNYPAFDWSILG